MRTIKELKDKHLKSNLDCILEHEFKIEVNVKSHNWGDFFTLYDKTGSIDGCAHTKKIFDILKNKIGSENKITIFGYLYKTDFEDLYIGIKEVQE